MRKIGEVVVHKNHGLCTIIDVKTMGDKDYYKATPNCSDNTTIYIPIANEEALIIKTMNVTEADDLLRYMKGIDEKVVVMDKQKRNEFGKMLTSGNRHDIAFLARTLYLLKQDCQKKNTKFGMLDSTMFEKADALLLDELSISYNVPRRNISAFISQRMEEI